MIDVQNRGSLVKMLLDVPLFEALDYTQIGAMLDIAETLRPESGTVLCESRSVDERLLILLDGTLRLESASGEFLDDMEGLRVIGEMGVFTGQLRSSRVVAREGALLLAIPAIELESLLEEDGQFAHHMFSSLIKLLYTRLHDINSEVIDLHDKVGKLKSRVSALSPEDPLLTELFPE
jgi:signal-transduction protein with cAMP-binding, CBS, and nucleotidyltransferase domain